MRRALIIATETYEDPEYSSLPGTQEDAHHLDEVLRRADIGGFDVVKVLRNEPGRTVAIEVEEFFKHATADDTLLLHISGHGETDDNGHLYFINSDTNSGLLNATALSAYDVRKEMKASPARRIIVLLDCCYSGAFNRGDGSRGRRVQSADFDVLQGRGRVVMTAATAVQRSYERAAGADPNGKSKGQFTRAVVDGLSTGEADANEDGFIDAAELFDYVRVHVSDKRQTPTYFADVVWGPLIVAKSIRTLPDPVNQTFPPSTRRSVFLFERPRKYLRAQLSKGPMPRLLFAVLLAGSVLLAGCATRADSVIAGAGCPTTTQLRVGVDPADRAAYDAVAADFERFVADRSQGCRSVHAYLFPLTAAEVTAGLAKGWTGVHPDVWFPAAGRDAEAVRSPMIEQVVPVAETPIVLGVPTARAPADDSLRAAAMSWPELFAAASRPAGANLPGSTVAQGWGVIRGDPTLSATARMVTAKLYVDKSPSAAHDDVEKWIEQRLDADRYPLGDEPSLLCRQLAIHRASPSARTPAVILTEQQLVRFNLGYSDGSCVPGEKPADPDRLAAFYPAQTPVVSKVAVQLRWPGGVQSAQTLAYARWLVKWLRTDEGLASLGGQGLRTPAIVAEGSLVAANGAKPDWPFGTLTDGETTVASAKKTADLYQKARRPARFLVALDASGSMNTVTDDPTVTRYEVAVAALQQAATSIGGRDELGVVTFSGPGDTPPRPVLDFTRPATGLSLQVGDLASKVRPAGETPLYQAVADGARRLRDDPGGAGRLRALVVLTDGRNTGRHPLPSAAQTAGVRVFVIAVGDVTCSDAALRKIAADSGGGCFDAGPDRLEDVFSGMFRALWDK